jgi:pimeloyl-ACP methyl ester carboxylesterase
MAQVQIDDTALEYVTEGGGEPLVLVHGSASDYRTWVAQTTPLAQRFRVISYSRRYHWPNKPILEGADYSMLEHVEDLRQVLQKLDAAPAHLVGHSYGGFVSLLLAVQYPHLVRTLVLTEPPVLPLVVSIPPKPADLLRLLVTRPGTALSIIRFGATWSRVAAAARRDEMAEVVSLTGKAVLGTDAYRRMAEVRLNQVRVNQFKAEYLGSGFAPLTAEEVGTVRVPTLLVNGARSPRLWHRLMALLAQLLPDSQRVTIPDASHIAHEDNAPAFNAAVMAFLTAHAMR